MSKIGVVSASLIWPDIEGLLKIQMINSSLNQKQTEVHEVTSNSMARVPKYEYTLFAISKKCVFKRHILHFTLFLPHNVLTALADHCPQLTRRSYLICFLHLYFSSAVYHLRAS